VPAPPVPVPPLPIVPPDAVIPPVPVDPATAVCPLAPPVPAALPEPFSEEHPSVRTRKSEEEACEHPRLGLIFSSCSSRETLLSCERDPIREPATGHVSCRDRLRGKAWKRSQDDLRLSPRGWHCPLQVDARQHGSRIPSVVNRERGFGLPRRRDCISPPGRRPSRGYGSLVVTTREPPVSEPEVALNVILPAVVVDWTMARALPLKADRDLPL
jgi:hypothetical protein